MQLLYVKSPGDIGCSSDPWGGPVMCPATYYSNFKFPGRGWYSGAYGGAAESQSFTWFPVNPTQTYDGDMLVTLALDKPLPDPGYPFAGINFAFAEPAYAIMQGDFALGANPITKYLTDTYGAKLAALWNGQFRAPILAQIAAGSVNRSGEFIAGAAYPYGSSLINNAADFAQMIGGKLNVSYETLKRDFAAVGGSADPIVAAYLDWFLKAQGAAAEQYHKMESADTRMQWTKFAVAASLAFGGAAAIMAIVEAAGTAAGIGGAEILKGAQLAYKAYNGIQTLSADLPESLHLPHTLSASTIDGMQAMVDQVTMNGLLQSSYSTTLEAMDLSQSDPVAAQAKLDEAQATFADAAALSQRSGVALPDNAVTAIAAAQTHAQEMIPSPEKIAMLDAANSAMAYIDAANPLIDAGDFDGAHAQLDTAALELTRAHELADQIGESVPPEYDAALIDALSRAMPAAEPAPLPMLGDQAPGSSALAPGVPGEAAPAGETPAKPYPWLFLALTLLGLGT